MSMVISLLLAVGFGYQNLTAISEPEIQTLKRLQFREIAAIGIEEAKTQEEEPYQLASAYCVDCDSAGNIYVLDHKSNCMKKFSKDGKFVKTILKEGNGPNEIENCFCFTINRFTGTLFVLQHYGFLIKEFGLDGNSVKRYVLPDQFYSLFEFIDKDRFIYISMETPAEKQDNCFKIFNIRTNTVEKKFAPYAHEISFNVIKRFVIKDNVLWTSSDNQMELLAFDLKNGHQEKRLKMPVKFKENFVKVVDEGRGYKRQQRIMYNFIQPFFLSQELYVLLTRQEYENEHSKVKSFPKRSTLTLYHVTKSGFQFVKNFKGYDGMKLSRVVGNLIILYTEDPYPLIEVIEASVSSQ